MRFAVVIRRLSRKDLTTKRGKIAECSGKDCGISSKAQQPDNPGLHRRLRAGTFGKIRVGT